MREAISNAGFGTRNGDQIYLLTEPQAAIAFALAQGSLFTVNMLNSSTNFYRSDADSDSNLARRSGME